MKPSALLLACHTQRFDASLIAQAQQDHIDEATVWAVENNNWTILQSLQPHSKYNCPSGSFKMVRLAVEHGSANILNPTISKEICNLMRNNPIHRNALIKSALCSTHAVGIAWLINNKSFFGLKDDLFHLILASNHNYLKASSLAVDVLSKCIPSLYYDWMHMALRCAEEGDIIRCVQYLKHTPDDVFDRANAIIKIIKNGLRCGVSQDFPHLLDAGRQLNRNGHHTTGEILSFFKETLENPDPQSAVESLFNYYGTNIDLSPLGPTISEKIQHHKALAQHKSISMAVETFAQPTKMRKM